MTAPKAPAFNNPAAPSLSGAPPVGVAASITGAGAYTPDWASLISNDPGLLDAKNALLAGNAGDLASRNALIQRALVNFGSVPDLTALAKQLGLSQEDLSGVAGNDIQQLAQENTDAGLSTKARLDQANQDAIRQITNELNKRGLLNSGEAGYELDRQNTGYRQAESDATQKLLDYLSQYQQGYAAAQAQKAQSLAQAYSDAANRQYASNQGSAGSTATLDHVDANGTAVYRSADGRLWNLDGSPYTPPPPVTSPPPAASPPSAMNPMANPGVGYQQSPRGGAYGIG